MSNYIRVDEQDLFKLCKDILIKNQVEASHAKIVSRVLIDADKSGIPSHGVLHLARHIADIKANLTNPNATPTIIKENMATALLDANFGFGAVSSLFAMNLAIEKAKKCGVGIVSVKNSCHHGITGYYVLQAIKNDMIGFATTNTAALVCPTFGLEARLGTNPIAFSAPSLDSPPFLLDMSTSCVTRGSLEICAKTGKDIPKGHAINQHGNHPINAIEFLDDLLSFKGGLLPLGGEGTANGGHKGYGLAMMVEILSALLSGNDYSINVKDTKETAAHVGHFFMAIDIASFRDVNKFKIDMSDFLNILQSTKPVDGIEKVIYSGLNLYNNKIDSEKNGVSLLENVFVSINKLSSDYNLNSINKK